MSDAVSVIQTLVAPVIMISACGLLCLAFYNRLSVLVSRIRTFHHERLALVDRLNTSPDPARDAIRGRIRQVDAQVAGIMRRARLVRLTLVCLVLCITLMVLCSICLGLALLMPAFAYASLALFVGGLLLTANGMLCALAELAQALSPVALERDFALGLAEHADAPPETTNP